MFFLRAYFIIIASSDVNYGFERKLKRKKREITSKINVLLSK